MTEVVPRLGKNILPLLSATLRLVKFIEFFLKLLQHTFTFEGLCLKLITLMVEYSKRSAKITILIIKDKSIQFIVPYSQPSHIGTWNILYLMLAVRRALNIFCNGYESQRDICVIGDFRIEKLKDLIYLLKDRLLSAF
jgi:hypothetical protein